MGRFLSTALQKTNIENSKKAGAQRNRKI